jgi:hypothetical protein
MKGSTMKQFAFLFFTLLITTTGIQAKHVPKKVMHHYCTEVASAQYSVPLDMIEAQMPIYKKKGFVVHGTYKRYRGRVERFSCRYDAFGKFQFIKKHTPRHTNSIQRRITHACKTEASVRWHVPSGEIGIRDLKEISGNRYKITLSETDRTGICNVTSQGYVNRFQTLNKHRYIPHTAEYGCIRKAASRWNIPTAYIEIGHTDYLGRDRYLLELSDDEYHASCEVKSNGTVYRFTEQSRPSWRR